MANASRNRPWVVALVLVAFAVLGWFFTDLYRLVNLRAPRSVFGWLPPEIFEQDHFHSFIVVTFAQGLDPTVGLRHLLVLLAAAFLCVYFAPVRLKRPLIALWFLVGGGFFFGAEAILALLTAHLFVYLVFHPRGPGASGIAGVAAALATVLASLGSWQDPAGVSVGLGLAALLGLAASRIHARWVPGLLAREVPGRAIRLIATHLPLIILGLGTLVGGLAGSPLVAPLGLVLLFWHYMRLLMYGVDVEDGLVPERLPVLTYLSVFFSPATLDSFPLGISIAQGYSYQTDRFLSRDKNELVLRGLALFGIGLVYMAFGPIVIVSLIELAARVGIQAYFSVPHLLQKHLVSHDVGTSTVLVTSLFQHLQWIFTVGGLFHFNVGMWRLLGYDVEPYMRFPLLATNLVTLWSRLTFHWREVLVRGFYYPIFLRMAGWPLWARSVAATLVAAGLANWLWAHLTETLIFGGMTTSSVVKTLWMWPYFFFLAGGIALSQVWVTWRGRARRPWSLDRWIALDVLAAYATAQFYGMIHIFYYIPYFDTGRPEDYWAIFLRGLGVG